MNLPIYYPIPADLLQQIVSLLNALPAHQSRTMLNELEAIVMQQTAANA